MSENSPQPFDAAAATPQELEAEFNRIQVRGTELASMEEPTAEHDAELTELASQLDVVKSALDDHATKAAATTAAREKFARKPEAPAAEPVVIEPTAVQKAAEPVAVPSVSEMAKATPAMPAKKTGPSGTTVTAFVSSDGAGLTGKRTGDAYDGLTEISEALIANAQQFGRVGGGKGSRHAIAQFRRERGAEFTVERDEDGFKVLQHARSEARLHGGSLAKQWQHNMDNGASLTAAAGWCAPSENRYELCRLWEGMTGILDLPTITVRRGGLNYTPEPTFQAIYANAVAVGGGSNFLTEAQVIADTVKTCSEIPCPTFTNRRLDVLALCVRVSFLQAAGYPELVNLWTDGLLAANMQEMNRLIIADMVTTAGAATVVTPIDPTGGDGWTSALLAAVEQAAEDIRYQQLMPFNATIEIVLPHWVIPQIRADLSRRNGVDLLAVTDADIARYFSVRNVRVQFVRGFQDGLITGGALNPAFPGGDITAPYMLALPQTVNFLAYPAGAVAVARQDVVTLTNVYDAASLATNEFTSLFAEEGFAPVYPCPGIRLYTVAGCPGGITGAAQISCA
jgi:hypothetical protein